MCFHVEVQALGDLLSDDRAVHVRTLVDVVGSLAQEIGPVAAGPCIVVFPSGRRPWTGLLAVAGRASCRNQHGYGRGGSYSCVSGMDSRISLNR